MISDDFLHAQSKAKMVANTQKTERAEADKHRLGRKVVCGVKIGSRPAWLGQVLIGSAESEPLMARLTKASLGREQTAVVEKVKAGKGRRLSSLLGDLINLCCAPGQQPGHQKSKHRLDRW